MKPYAELLARLAPSFPPDPEVRVLPDMHAKEYRGLPGINPSFIKAVRSKSLATVLAEQANAEAVAAGQDMPYPPIHKRTAKPKHFELGSLVHTLILEPDKLDRDYAVVTDSLLRDIMSAARTKIEESDYSARFGEAQAWKTRNGRLPETAAERLEVMAERALHLTKGAKASEQPEFLAWQDEQLALGKTVIWQGRLDDAKRVADGFWKWTINDQPREILNIPGRLVEPSVLGCASTGGLQAQLKGRPDFVCGGIIGDLKTLGMNKRYEDWDNESNRFGYDLAAGAYIRMLESCGVKVNTVVFLVVETEIPHRAVTWAASATEERFVMGGDQFQETLDLVGRAVASGEIDRVCCRNLPQPLPEVAPWRLRRPMPDSDEEE